MANRYLVTKRIKEDRVYVPGEIVTDDDVPSEILLARGYLQPIPSDFVSPAATPAPTSASTPTPDLSTAESSEVGMDDLMALSRAELNEVAKKQGVDHPEGFKNRRQLATAILDKIAEPEAEG
jgi:hypothetical protein